MAGHESTTDLFRYLVVRNQSTRPRDGRNITEAGNLFGEGSSFRNELDNLTERPRDQRKRAVKHIESERGTYHEIRREVVPVYDTLWSAEKVTQTVIQKAVETLLGVLGPVKCLLDQGVQKSRFC